MKDRASIGLGSMERSASFHDPIILIVPVESRRVEVLSDAIHNLGIAAPQARREVDPVDSLENGALELIGGLRLAGHVPNVRVIGTTSAETPVVLKE
jgi:hypothetical protein